MTTLGMTLITELISLIKFPQQLHRIIIIIIARESDPENRYAVHFLFMMEVKISFNDPLSILSGCQGGGRRTKTFSRVTGDQQRPGGRSGIEVIFRSDPLPSNLTQPVDSSVENQLKK